MSEHDILLIISIVLVFIFLIESLFFIKRMSEKKNNPRYSSKVIIKKYIKKARRKAFFDLIFVYTITGLFTFLMESVLPEQRFNQFDVFLGFIAFNTIILFKKDYSYGRSIAQMIKENQELFFIEYKYKGKVITKELFSKKKYKELMINDSLT